MHGSEDQIIRLKLLSAFIGKIYHKSIPACVNELTEAPAKTTEASMGQLKAIVARWSDIDPVTTKLKHLITTFRPFPLDELFLLDTELLKAVFENRLNFPNFLQRANPGNPAENPNLVVKISLALEVTAESHKGKGLLHIATKNKLYVVMEDLITAGFNVNDMALFRDHGINTSNRCTPLYFALKNLDLKALEILVNNGADVELWHETGTIDSTNTFTATEMTSDFLPSLVAYRDALISNPDESKLVAMQNHLTIANFLKMHGARIDLSFVSTARTIIAAQAPGYGKVLSSSKADGASVTATIEDLPAHIKLTPSAAVCSETSAPLARPAVIVEDEASALPLPVKEPVTGKTVESLSSPSLEEPAVSKTPGPSPTPSVEAPINPVLSKVLDAFPAPTAKAPMLPLMTSPADDKANNERLLEQLINKLLTDKSYTAFVNKNKGRKNAFAKILTAIQQLLEAHTYPSDNNLWEILKLAYTPSLFSAERFVFVMVVAGFFSKPLYITIREELMRSLKNTLPASKHGDIDCLLETAKPYSEAIDRSDSIDSTRVMLRMWLYSSCMLNDMAESDIEKDKKNSPA
ncbi:MAG: hypothetical protein Q7V63_06730 [Gammaproteobacteria bacterium]|nr:hypothetical protein [Gammaproteobacteria bacterium]